MKIIVDADSICYYAAFATNKDDKTVDDCYEVIDMVYANIIEDMPNNCNDIESYVGGEGNFRFDIYLEYKATGDVATQLQKLHIKNVYEDNPYVFNAIFTFKEKPTGGTLWIKYI